MTVKKLIIINILAVLFFAAIFYFDSHANVELGPGVFAPDVPIQKNLKEIEITSFKGYSLEFLAEFEITGKILSKENYYLGREAELSPFDFVMGWGRMSDEAVLNRIEISQSRRWYHWKTKHYPIPRREIEISSANMHMIPATDEIERQLDSYKVGNIVFIKGYLIYARASDGWHWKSSTTREDTGGGACEVIFVKSTKLVK